MRGLSAATLAVLLSACAGPQGLGLQPGADSPDTIFVAPVRNLSGVPLRVPEMYVGDMLGGSDLPDIGMIDLDLVAEAALRGTLRAGDFRLTEPAARFQVHAAITEYDTSALRATGRYRMGIVLLLIGKAGLEVARGGAVREFQLFSRPPQEVGALGDERFVRTRIEGFTEALARDALADLGLGRTATGG